MSLSNEPIHRSPGQQQQFFPYIDRAIRLLLIVEAAARAPIHVLDHGEDQDQVIINRVIEQMTNAVTPRVTRSNGESPRRGRPTRLAEQIRAQVAQFLDQ